MAWIYTVSVSTFMGLLVGLTQVVLGTPGDLPEIVKSIHEKGFVAPEQAPSMFVCSAFSIVAGTCTSLRSSAWRYVPPLAACARVPCGAELRCCVSVGSMQACSTALLIAGPKQPPVSMPSCA